MMNYASGYGVNPYLNPQQQLNNLIQQYPQYFNQNAQAQQTNVAQIQGLRTIPVTNREEAVATPVDVLNGTPTFFYNKAKDEVYLKQVIDINTGNAIVKDYVLVEKNTNNNVIDKPIAKEIKKINSYEKDFENLNDKIDSLESTIDDLKNGLKHSIDKLLEIRGNKNAK